MRNLIIVTTIALMAILAIPSEMPAQAQGGGNQGQGGGNQQARRPVDPNVPIQVGVPSIAPPPGWKRCPRCQNNEDRRIANLEERVANRAFNPHNIDGIWGWNGIGGVRGPTFRNPPPMTELGKQLYAETMGEKLPNGEISSKDTTGLVGGSKLNCDPYGTTRLYTYNYGFEFMTLPDRVLQFFELTHTWRTIWTDGRKLPENPLTPRWLGWNVGRWEGDTFVVESNGYEERGWVDAAAGEDGGWPHSDQMKITERYRRVNYNTLEAQLTLVDPKVYTAPWVTPTAQVTLATGTELWEDYCVPSDYQEFNEAIYDPASK